MMIVKILVVIILYILFFLDVKKNNKYFKKPVLFFLNRFLIITILTLLLFNFNFSFDYSKKNQNKVKVFFDNSLSAKEQMKVDSMIVVQLSEFIKKLDKEDIPYELYSFDSDIKNIQMLNEIDFSGLETNFDKLLSYILETNSKNNIIISDGINTGSPINNKLKDLDENKIYTIGLGSNIINENISIENVNFIHSSFLSDSIISIVDFSYTLDKTLNKKIEFIYKDKFNNNQRNINLSKGVKIYGFEKFILNKDKLEELEFIEIEPIASEIDKYDNILNVQYRKLFDFDNVLLISGELSNNTAMIKKIIKLFDVNLFSHQYRIKSNWNKNYETSDYDLIVFDNFPMNENDFIRFKQNINSNDKMIFFSGKNLGIEVNNLISGVSDMNYKIEENIEKYFDFKDSNINKSFPPISSNINWIPDMQSECLLSYKDGSCAIIKKKNIVYVFIGSLQSYILQLKKDINVNIFNNLLLKNLFLGLNEESNLVQTRIKKTTFDLNEIIVVQLLPYVKSDLELAFEVLDSSNKIIFNEEIENFSNIENIKFNIDKAGEYSLITKLVDNSKIQFQSEKKIVINDINIEMKNIFLNQYYLKNISSSTNSKYYHLSDLSDLISNFERMESLKSLKYTFSYLSLNKFLWLLIILISLDWYLRVRKGIL